MIKTYIASPYTIGNHLVNVLIQIGYAHELIGLGFNPYVPLLSHYLEEYKHQEYETWMSIDLEWLKTCDCLLRLPGESSGADREVAFAIKKQIPVFYDIKSLIKYYSKCDLGK